MGKVEKTIAVSAKLYESLKQSADDSGFESIEEFVNFILEEVVNNKNKRERELTEDEKKEIDKGLKEMGYKFEKTAKDSNCSKNNVI